MRFYSHIFLPPNLQMHLYPLPLPIITEAIGLLLSEVNLPSPIPMSPFLGTLMPSAMPSCLFLIPLSLPLSFPLTVMNSFTLVVFKSVQAITHLKITKNNPPHEPHVSLAVSFFNPLQNHISQKFSPAPTPQPIPLWLLPPNLHQNCS